MGGGGRSSSSSSSTTTNTSGQNAIQGDNLGVAVSGINNSTVNVTSTDHGAVKGALEMGSKLVEQSGEMLDKSLSFGESALDGAFDFGKDALEGSLELAGDVTEKLRNQNSESMQMLAGLSGQQAASNSENIGALLELAKFNKDGGASETNNDNKMIIIVVAAVLGAVAIMAVKGGK